MRNTTVWMVCLVVVIIGALNWLLVGLARFDLVAAIAGRHFGDVGPFNATIYVLVGIAGIYLAISSMVTRGDIEQKRSPTRMMPR